MFEVGEVHQNLDNEKKPLGFFEEPCGFFSSSQSDDRVEMYYWNSKNCSAILLVLAV